MIQGGPSVKLGTFFGVPTYFELFHLFIPFMLVAMWYMPVAEAANVNIVLVSIGGILLAELSLMAHEFAHVRMGQVLGYRTKEVRMIMFGAVANMEGTGKSARDAFLIAAAGPAVSFMLWALSIYVIPIFFPDAGMTLGVIIYLTGYLNLILGLFNMLPAYPTDGGRILVSIIWAVTKDFVKAMKAGAVVGIATAAYGVYYGYINDGLVLMFMATFVILINVSILRSSYAKILSMKGAKTL